MSWCLTQSHNEKLQGFSRHEIAQAVVLAMRDVFYCCDLVIVQQVRNYKKKTEEEKLCKLMLQNCCLKPWGEVGNSLPLLIVSMYCKSFEGNFESTTWLFRYLIYHDQNTVFGNNYSKKWIIMFAKQDDAWLVV